MGEGRGLVYVVYSSIFTIVAEWLLVIALRDS